MGIGVNLLLTLQTLILPSHQSSFHYICPNGLKLYANFMNVIQTSWIGYKHPEWDRTSKTLNLFKVFWQSFHSESVLKNVVRTSLR